MSLEQLQALEREHVERLRNAVDPEHRRPIRALEIGAAARDHGAVRADVARFGAAVSGRELEDLRSIVASPAERALAALALALSFALAVPARAEDRVTVRGAYYREASTRVVQPMLQLSTDLPEGFDLSATALVDAISSAAPAFCCTTWFSCWIELLIWSAPAA